VTVASAPDVARRVADALAAAGVEYAIGGALALAVWGFPRATNDVDVDVFVEADAIRPVLDALASGGLDIDAAAAVRSARERGDFRGRLSGVRVDCFVMTIPLYASARKRVRVAPLAGRPAVFLAPEDLAIFKLLFFRTKDLLDVERMVAFLGAEFDRGYVRSWLVNLVGTDDARIASWDRLVADVPTL
jgi:hypothetical protein